MMVGKNHGSAETCAQIPVGSVGVEIGVWKGDSSARFLTRASHLHLVDAWSPVAYEHSHEHGNYERYLDRYATLVGSRDPADFQRYYDKIYEGVCQRFSQHPVTIHRMRSKDFFLQFDQQVDWVYVDGDHSYQGVMHDLTQSLRILRPDGIILGDDYAAAPPAEGGFKPEVKHAVDAFVTANGLRFKNFYGTQYKISK
jgi:hypothetical protein